ncbi:AsmA-like C-terminal region-containing protein [uncultured Chitinophaga sp.]|mgnify:CR=1 FL=1|uniref:AsmA family protein n=1 Tax=uncultured Chitinophaga sp. TaxID=339340 RepID=UPI002608DA2C|nr:AsmA-like C-terminal region-containing protein [uncultured Chitinophaga sp.]
MPFNFIQARWLRICVIAGCALLGLVIVLWLALALYIHLNRETFLRQITDRLNQRLHGTLTIQEMNPSLLRSFPHVSIELETLQLKDSLWQQHRHLLLDVKRIFVKVNTFTLLRRRMDIREITMEDGTIYLYTNASGYTNATVFSGKEQKKEGSSGKDADIGKLSLRNMELVLDNQQKNKRFHFTIRRMDGRVDASDKALQFDVQTRLLVNSFSFNTLRGSYLRNQELETTLTFNFNKQQKKLSIPAQRFSIGGQSVTLSATFDFGHDPAAFAINIGAVNMPYHHATSLLLPHLQQKLDSIDLQQPLDVQAMIKGHMRPHDTPDVRVKWHTENNILVTKAGQWDSCGFNGNFTNELIPGYGHHDANSAVRIYQLHARWSGVPLNADTIQVLNLKHPELMGRFRSAFPLQQLNELTGNTYEFQGGTATANLFYKGSILAGDSLTPYLDGDIAIRNGSFTYLPRNLQFRDCNATIQFSGQDLFFHQVMVKSVKSTLQMEGSMRNIVGLFFKAPEKIQLDWDIRSPMIDLDEFRFFLAPRKTSRHKTSKAAAGAASRKARRLARQLEIVMESCNVNMRIAVDKLNYRRFDAAQVMAAVSLTQSDILLQQVSLAHAGGSLRLNGAVHPQGNNNRFKLNGSINNVHIDQLFYAFENFGMQSLTSRNLKGILSARANINGNLHDNGQLAPGSMYGELSFDLKQGALVHFAPLEDIGTFFFRKRNLSNITFDNLSNTLQLKGNKIIIPPMQISSSAIMMDVSGVYGMPRGTDIYLEVPLRNPEKIAKKGKRGFTLHLRATDDNKEGKVKIKLGKQ